MKKKKISSKNVIFSLFQDIVESTKTEEPAKPEIKPEESESKPEPKPELVPVIVLSTLPGAEKSSSQGG